MFLCCIMSFLLTSSDKLFEKETHKNNVFVLYYLNLFPSESDEYF